MCDVEVIDEVAQLVEDDGYPRPCVLARLILLRDADFDVALVIGVGLRPSALAPHDLPQDRYAM